MRISLAIVLVFIVMGLALGCAQAAASTAGEKPPATVTQAAVPAAVRAVDEAVISKEPVSNPSPNSSQPSTALQLTKIKDILQNPKAYSDQTVIVEGKIISECGSGCWFTLKDASALIYIDLAPNNMVIPQKRGSNARVTGKVIYEGSDVYLVGSKVDF
jgi:uncharacterized protein YdeI (BOF family)